MGVEIWMLHHNPQVWEDPHHYRPDRFLGDNLVKMDPFQYVPFSAGPRQDLLFVCFVNPSSVHSSGLNCSMFGGYFTVFDLTKSLLSLKSEVKAYFLLTCVSKLNILYMKSEV